MAKEIRVSSEYMALLYQKLQEVADVIDPSLQMSFKLDEKTSKMVFEMLDWIRTSVTYMKFDTECCRREMRKLREIIDQQGGAKG